MHMLKLQWNLKSAPIKMMNKLFHLPQRLDLWPNLNRLQIIVLFGFLSRSGLFLNCPSLKKCLIYHLDLEGSAEISDELRRRALCRICESDVNTSFMVEQPSLDELELQTGFCRNYAKLIFKREDCLIKLNVVNVNPL